MADMIGMQDGTRIVLRMAGADAREVLQGVVTNDVDQVAPGRSIYAALLTPQGKYLSDFFLLDGGNGDILIDVAREQVASLAPKLKMYGLRRQAALSVEEDCEVGLAWLPPEADGVLADVVAPASSSGAIVADPRDPALGWRRYGPDTAAWIAEAGVASASPEDRDGLLVKLLVPESGVELVPDETYVLEAGFERLSGVDFSKGCYVGQEITARM